MSIPQAQAAGVVFSDTLRGKGILSGNIRITKATNESTINEYVIYWGDKNRLPLVINQAKHQAVASLPVNGSNQIDSLANVTIAPGTAHFLVVTKNAQGVMKTWVSIFINDIWILHVTFI